MLHRSYSLLNFVRHSVSHHSDQLFIFQVRYSKQQASILVTSRFIHVLSNSRKICNRLNANSIQELRIGVLNVLRFSTKRVDGQEVPQVNQVKSEKDRTIQTESKLGKLKDRILNVNIAVSGTDATDKQDPKTFKKSDVLKGAPQVNQVKSDKERTVQTDSKLGKLKDRILNVNIAVSGTDATDKQDQKTIKKSDVLLEEAAIKSASAKKKRADRNTESLERNFITPMRAATDFLLRQSDLETLPKTKRRSPYEHDPPITVYWRKDVEAKALEVWGSREALLKEVLKKERKIHEQNFFTVKRRVREYRREEMSKNNMEHINRGILGRSGKVVLTAVTTNLFNFFCKFFAWLSTGSHSMFSECVHSAADTLNQVILAYGIQKSVQNPNPDHPYGYTNMQYVTALASGVGILCVGAGLSIYHGCHGLMFPNNLESFYWAYVTLACSFVLDGISLCNAYMSTKKMALEKGKTVKEYVMSLQDPSVNVVLMEDLAAVVGVLCAATCMGLTSYLANPAFDAIGSLLVGGVLGGVSIFIIRTNTAALVGRSIPQELLDKINAVLEADIMVRTIHDVKGIDMGNNVVRYKAELDFDGRELTRSYLDKHDLNRMFEEVKQMQSIDELETFLLNHGENIVDTLGGEIDRIELKLKKKHPEIRHCDLEIS